MTIYQQAKAVMANGSSTASGIAVHVFGLMFLDSGQWKMVASRIGST